MLVDKTEILNRLEISACTDKSHSFGQSIKNPYLAQYKIFQERLRNPKLKSMSMIMRKRKNDEDLNKQNISNDIKIFEQEECLKQAKKLINNDQNKFSVFPINFIDYESNETERQSQVLLKFKQKLQELKMIRNQMNSDSRSIISNINFIKISRYPKTEASSSVGSYRKKYNDSKPQTAAQRFARQRSSIVQREYVNSNNSVNQKKSKLPITFISYKRNKSFAERFTKERK